MLNVKIVKSKLPKQFQGFNCECNRNMIYDEDFKQSLFNIHGISGKKLFLQCYVCGEIWEIKQLKQNTKKGGSK